MRHHNVVRKFGRKSGQRNALFRSLARNLVNCGKIVTTEAKAKELRPFVEKMITRAKNDTPSNRRLLVSRLGSSVAVRKMVEEVSKKYKERSGGYTRIVKLGQRQGDASSMALIEFV